MMKSFAMILMFKLKPLCTNTTHFIIFYILMKENI